MFIHQNVKEKRFWKNWKKQVENFELYAKLRFLYKETYN